MGQSNISEQAEKYAEVIVGQIAGNFRDLDFAIKNCPDLKKAQKEHDEAKSDGQDTLKLKTLQDKVDIIKDSIGSGLCDDKYSAIEPLAVGLFGEWGSGKTHQLKLIKQRIIRVQNMDKNKEDNKKDFPKRTIPIFFNAWRFEKEEHIILPLFETLLKDVEAFERPLKEKGKVVVNKLTTKLKVGALSLQKGLRTPDSFKSVAIDALSGNYGGALMQFFDTGKFTEEVTKKTNEELVGDQKIGEMLNPEKLESIYLNITEWIKHITLTEDVNFVFLIDDLDRCLPENTLKMLESIKLFLDVPSCAFVLAVDDDVVERGVVHHYKDYLSIYHHKDTQDAKGVLQHELPITGHEYLEKMIQLPIRLPVIDTVNVREFLKKHSLKWITLIDKKENSKGLRTASTSIVTDEKLDVKEEFYISPAEKLLDFFKDTIPPKPRKIKRTAKLFESKVELLYAMELEGKCSYELLAKITLLELFAPKILRFIQNNDYAETYKALYDFHYVQDVEKKEKKNTLYDTDDIIKFIKKNTDYTQEKKDRYTKLIDMIGEHHSSRMVFDLSTVFRKSEEYEALKVAIEYKESTIVTTTNQDESDKSLLDEEIMSQLFLENNPETWGATLRTHNKLLTLQQVNSLIKKANEKIDSKFKNFSFITNPEWIGQISRFVDNESYKLLLKASHKARFKTIKEKTQIDMFQLTFAEYDKYCDMTGEKKPKDEGWGRGRRPVINVSWDDVKKYVEWLNEFLEPSYALPTEDDWYLACNNSETTKWHFGDKEEELKEYAWYDENSDGKTHPVGEKKPNALNLYDMHGNVWEWCEDWYDEKKDTKVLRGGSWYDDSAYTHSSIRFWVYPTNGSGIVGFRLQRTLLS
jgi:predicted KAP-like P-loop ATPase